MSNGRFGIHGGQYIPETLMNAVIELEKAYDHYKEDPAFVKEYNDLLNEYVGRPSRLYYASHMTEDLGGAKIYLKREDLNHTGSHKLNNALGQALLAKKMGKKRLIAETGAGQHGVATATVAALLGMECEIYMGKVDTDRQALNVYRMELLGAKVHPVTSGTQTLKDAVNETLREWTRRIDDTHYVIGSVMGPHPFPTIVRDFQSVIGKEIKQQMLEKEGRLPDVVMACVGGGSNAMGAFYDFIPDKEVELIGCEAAGRGIHTADTAATIATGTLGVFHGMKSYFCQDEYGQIAPVYSISAGLDYPGIGPEHAALFDAGRARYVAITDEEAVEAFEKGKAFIPFVTCGDPSLDVTEKIVYAMEENGVLTGYDYLPEEPYTISVTLKDLQEKIHQQMLYDKASAYTYDSDKSAPKLAVIFPGIGYTADKPLLYYASRLARHYGYQILAVSYGTLPENVKGDHAKMKQAFELAYEQTEQALQDIDWNSYGSILFISKSIGTVIASAYASRHNIKGKSILFTPLTGTFSFARPGSIAFHGTADPWAETDSIRTLAEQKEVPLFLTPNANHSLETGDVQADLSIIKATMEHVNRFIATP